MDIRKVKKLIELLEESGISEIEIKEGEETVRISRHPPGGVHTYPAPMAMRRRRWRRPRRRARRAPWLRRRPDPHMRRTRW